MFSITPQELDKALKFLDSNLRVRRYGYPYCVYHNYTDALTYKGEHIGSVPHGKVYDKRIEGYYSQIGDYKISQRSLNHILRLVAQYLKPYKVKKFRDFIRTKNWLFLRGD